MGKILKSGMKKINFKLYIYIGIFCIVYGNTAFSQEVEKSSDSDNVSIIEKMDNYTAEKKALWQGFQPFRRTEAERRMVGWQDPHANISRFWIGDSLNAEAMYGEAFHTDDISAYFTPTVAMEFTAVPVDIGNVKLRLGLGLLMDLNMCVYNEYMPLYGKNFIFSDYVQVEVHLDVIINDIWKVRLIPLRHGCQHNSGDYYGDPLLYDLETTGFADSGNEGMALQVFNLFGWFTFYGGIEANYHYLFEPTFVTLFGAHIGTDMRFPIWGDLSIIAGIYASYDYIQYAERVKELNDEGVYVPSLIGDPEKEWKPTVSVGIGVEIDRMTFSFKYMRRPSQQLHSHREIEERIGFEGAVYVF